MVSISRTQHDTFVAAVLNALGVFNDMAPPFGATLVFELHQLPAARRSAQAHSARVDLPSPKPEFVVRSFYLNATETEQLHPLAIPACNFALDCPLTVFLQGVQDLLVTDWSGECNPQPRTLGSLRMPNQLDLDSGMHKRLNPH